MATHPKHLLAALRSGGRVTDENGERLIKNTIIISLIWIAHQPDAICIWKVGGKATEHRKDADDRRTVIVKMDF
jgi:hypothetical protein